MSWFFWCLATYFLLSAGGAIAKALGFEPAPSSKGSHAMNAIFWIVCAAGIAYYGGALT